MTPGTLWPFTNTQFEVATIADRETLRHHGSADLAVIAV